MARKSSLWNSPTTWGILLLAALSAIVAWLTLMNWTAQLDLAVSLMSLVGGWILGVRSGRRLRKMGRSPRVAPAS
jgi:hypothetical protein